MNTRLMIIIPAAQQTAANTLCAGQFTGGENTFTVPLNPSGDPAEPPTHYWCSWVVNEPSAAWLRGTFHDAFPAAQIFEGALDQPIAAGPSDNSSPPANSSQFGVQASDSLGAVLTPPKYSAEHTLSAAGLQRLSHPIPP